MRRRIVLCGLGFGLVAISACGLDAIGGAPGPDVVDAVDSGSSDEPDGAVVVPDDAGADVDAAPPPADTSCTTSDPPCTPPDGWEPVAMRIDEGDGCPEAYTPVELSEASLVDPQQACTCTPVTSTQDPPRCDKQKGYPIVYSIATPPACLGIMSTTVDIDGNGCVQVSGNDWTALKASPIAPLPGSCTPDCAEVAGHLTKTAVHLCMPSTDCRDGACRGAQTGTKTDDYVYCFVKDGDVAACPGDPDRTVRRTIGASPSVTCMGATCKNNVKCNNPAVHPFKDPNCSSPLGNPIPVDDKCNPASEKGIKALKYEVATVPSPVMDVQPTASVTYAETKTLCCPTLD